MYEFSHEQKKYRQFNILVIFIIHLWCLLQQSSEQTVFDFPKKLKDKRPQVGLNHQPFGILN